jgi:beta-glucanase (GH16 family)
MFRQSSPRAAVAIALVAVFMAMPAPLFGQTELDGAAIPAHQAAWKLTWADEFDGSTLDRTKWKYETGFGKNGWGNRELQCYTEGDNIEVEGGVLRMTAKKIGKGQARGDYTSARLNSLFNFRYGRVEVRAKMPVEKGSGLWPAIWMLGQNITTVGWPKCGELDIMEYVSRKPNRIASAIHTQANNHTQGGHLTSHDQELSSAEEEFHVYGLEWTEAEVRFFVDDHEHVILRFARPQDFNEDNWPFDKPQYLLLNLAVGGTLGGRVDDAVFPNSMEIDFVRVYQRQ